MAATPAASTRRAGLRLARWRRRLARRGGGAGGAARDALLGLLCASAVPDAATARALRGMAAPVAPALRALLRRLAALLRQLADALEGGAVQSGGTLPHTHVLAGVDDALEALEARHGAAVVRLRRRCGDTTPAAIPPSEAMLSLHALLLCTRLLVRAAHDVGRAVHALLPAPAHGDECDHEKEEQGARRRHAQDASAEAMTRERSTAQLLAPVAQEESGDEELAAAGSCARCACGARLLDAGAH